MAAFDYTPAQSLNAGFSGRIGFAFSSLVATVAQWNAARSTRAQLSKLTDRELSDIGLSRGNIADF
ncbi:DUF1127 domain-containing protein [Cognatishimia activa]|uniref:DUF1127 domain-containing protein n=1 Tax=Cognatishimia activa TaxID=1715691 RepID=A0A975EMV4_9RHOB|nr:DUF1127 domain-containing protein [Cognatishimia activa]QTN34968.1 DUF1127 domain-containing protein [Cognatishimia activa]